jgi:hypothetical protein
MRDIALGDVRVLVLCLNAVRHWRAGEQPHPTWTQEAHSRTVERWLGASARCNIPGGVRASGRHEGNRLPGHGDEMYLRKAEPGTPAAKPTPGDGAENDPGPPVSGTTHHTYASAAQRPCAPAAIQSAAS